MDCFLKEKYALILLLLGTCLLLWNLGFGVARGYPISISWYYHEAFSDCFQYEVWFDGKIALFVGPCFVSSMPTSLYMFCRQRKYLEIQELQEGAVSTTIQSALIVWLTLLLSVISFGRLLYNLSLWSRIDFLLLICCNLPKEGCWYWFFFCSRNSIQSIPS